jgi:sugar porter (SP) family MFS transporter
VTVALAGFLFGFDTVVISGADLALQDLWPRGDFFHGTVVMASALWGTVLGAMLGNIPVDRLGRKQSLLWIGILYTVSAIGSALAHDPWVFAAARFIGGVAIGVSTIAAPAFISEIAPAGQRGRLVATYQLNIVLGILIAFVSNYLLSGTGTNAWRWMMGVEAFPAIAYTLLVLGIPESPRWLLIRKGDEETATAILRRIRPDADPMQEIAGIRADHAASASTDSIFSPAYRRALLLAFFIAFFNQFSGINAFLYYAPRIFREAGLEAQTALLSSVGIGVTNLIFTVVGMALIDRLGRRQLLYIGSVGYIFSLSMVAVAFAAGWTGMAVPGFLFLFIAAHAIGQGTVIWVFIAEIFPNHLRAQGQAFGSSVHWVLAAAIPSLMPVAVSALGAATVFASFAFMMVLQLVWVWRSVPETKGMSLEQLDRLLRRRQ